VVGQRGPGQRAGLTRAAVLDAARELLAAGGAEAVTMRAVARRLAVAPNALYSHVPSKTALLDDLLDDLLAAVHSPSPDVDDPVAGLEKLMRSTYSALTSHPLLVPIYVQRQGARGPNAVRLGSVMDALLTRAGVRRSRIAEARRALIIHTIGFAAFSTGADSASSPERPLPATELARNHAHSLRWLLAGITGP
jgi:TetR/AcrR family tetracycline transcriptional repressor